MPVPRINRLAKEESDSLLFKAAEFLNRTNSASMGAVTEMLQGGDIGAAVGGSLTGKQVYGGQDVMAALLGGSPDDKFNRRAGLVADILNPLDPLNYVGVGALTKTGKLAKLGKGLEMFGDAGLRAAKESAPAKGMVRLYRAESEGAKLKPVPDWLKQDLADSGHIDAKGRWFTDAPETLDYYIKEALDDGGNARIKYVDVPKETADQWRVSNLDPSHPARKFASPGARANEMFLPRDLADAAKSPMGGLAQGASAQAKAGQRGLVTFAGQRVPLPGDAAMLGLLEKGGTALKESGAGRGLQKLFGGKEAYVRESVQPLLKAAGVNSQQDVETVLGAYSRANQADALYRNSTQKFVDELRVTLKKKDWAGFDDFLDQAGKGPQALMEDAARFIGSGPGADRRRKAVEAAQGFFAQHGRLANQMLGNEGIGGMASSQVGYIPRKYLVNGKVRQETIPEGFDPAKTGEAIRLEGAADNHLNRMLSPRSEEPVSRTMLTKAGQLEYDRLGPAALEKMRRENPKAYAEWHQKNRLPMKDAITLLENMHKGAVSLEQTPWKLISHIQRQTADKIRVDTLVNEIVNAKTLDGKALYKKWDEIAPEERSKWVLINQGKWNSNPIGIPKIYDEAIAKANEAFMPAPDKPLFGAFLQEVLPKSLANAGLLSWWKGFATVGNSPLGPLMPTGYMTRNLVGAMLKNRLEMDTGDFARFIPEAANVIGQSLKSKLDPSAVWAKGDFVTKQNIPVSREWLMRQYWDRNFHGGGSRDDVISEVVGELDNVSASARERVFGAAHRGNFRVEMMARMPLMLKAFEDTLDIAQKAGVKLPPRIDMGTEILPRSAVDVALTNAREAVIRTHFDYDDLTPFEKKLRARWIPFYTWMRKNIPHETVNMVQQPGKYMPFARAYYNAYEQQQITPEDLPKWAARSFAMPISPGEGDRARWLDWTGFLPFMDVMELGQTAGIGLGLAEPEPGRTRAAEVIRYMATRANPFMTKAAEQGLQKSFFTGRSFSQDMPMDVAGVTVGAPTRNALELAPPLMALDRLNPGGIFGKTPRPHRNEPEQPERIMRMLSGVKTYSTDKDESSLSTRARQRKIQELRRAESRELRAGNQDGAEFIRKRRIDLEKGR